MWWRNKLKKWFYSSPTPQIFAGDVANCLQKGEEDGVLSIPSKEYGKLYMYSGTTCMPRENRCPVNLMFGQKADTSSNPKAALLASSRTIAFLTLKQLRSQIELSIWKILWNSFAVLHCNQFCSIALIKSLKYYTSKSMRFISVPQWALPGYIFTNTAQTGHSGYGHRNSLLCTILTRIAVSIQPEKQVYFLTLYRYRAEPSLSCRKNPMYFNNVHIFF